MKNNNFKGNTMLKQNVLSSNLVAQSQVYIDSPPIDISKSQGILELLDEACSKFKQQTAIKSIDKQISYSLLNIKANRLANCLIANQLSKGAIIAVILDDKIEAIATIIGIFRAGCVFVPLNPEFPEERLRQIVADVSPDCFITQPKFSKLVTQIYSESQKNSKILNIEESAKYPSDFSSKKPSVLLAPDEICYIYYTSGSTGKPKGIAGKIKGISHFVKWEIETFNIVPGWQFSQFTSFTFDAFLRDIFVPLCSGGTICIPPELPARMETKLLIDWIDQNKINLIHCVPSLFGTFINSNLDNQKFNSLRYILMSGETLPVSDVKKWWEVYSNRIKLVNLYGATETTMVKFYHQVQESDLERGFIPIGKPMEGTRAVVLDEYGNVCPRGVFGELYIRTPYRTLGYYKNPELTKQVFVQNPFSENPHDFIYKTGDVVRVLNDGNFQLRGRKDNQVKIRGIRVELGDIENQLRNHHLVKSAVVLAREDNPGDKRLVAYVVPKQEPKPTISELRNFLKQKLPDYMVPNAFVFLDIMPLTRNGKVDRHALPASNLAKQELETNFAAPRDDLERELAQIWEEVLNIKSISVQDNFFDLGGHSLLAVRLFAQIEKRFGISIPLATLFQSGTIETLAKILSQEQQRASTYKQEESKTSWSSVVKIQPHGTKVPLFCIHPLGGEILCYRDLAMNLGSDRPVYGLQPQGLDGKLAPYTRVEDMAAHYIQEIQTIQPNGPYFLVGYSFGGTVAFEMAQQFHRQGEKVGCLIMLDTCRPGYSKRSPFLKRIVLHLQKILQGGTSYLRHKLTGWREWGTYHLKERYKRHLGVMHGLAETDKHLTVIDANVQAASEYTFQVYPGKITLLRTEDQNRDDAVGIEYDPQFGWGDLIAGGLDVHYVPGSHLTLLEEPHVKVLAAKLKACLTQASLDQ
jgi:amino acid adenylation domain-containing protein